MGIYERKGISASKNNTNNEQEGGADFVTWLAYGKQAGHYILLYPHATLSDNT